MDKEGLMRGYLRPDGRVGIRNRVLVLPTVGCANHVAARIASAVPGCVTLPNSKGCGQVGTGIQIMRRCLVNLTQNPNVAATLLVGLGCETTRPYELLESIKQLSDKPVEILTIQECGGSVNAIARGTEIARGLVIRAARAERPALDPSQIVLGTNCGGSDATSGLAANPAIGIVSDAIVESGGTVMLGETTELIGTEDILAARAGTGSVARDILRIVHGLETEFDEAHVDVRGANPSPGNMRGGLSTLEEKALGGIVKGGTSPITEVVGYGEIPSQRGLVIMDTPGYDIESISGMIAGGAQAILFSTGRGTPIGNQLVPIIKVTGNDEVASSMGDNIDFDASSAILGESSVASLGGSLLDLLEGVCDGVKTKAEVLGFNDFSIYHNQELWCTCEQC